MYTVYVLRSEKTGRRYVGSTGDMERRFREHQGGRNKATRHGVPWRLVYTEKYSDRAEAVRRERYLKTGVGREELDEMGV